MTQVARDPGFGRNLTVGEPLVRQLLPAQFGKPVQLLRPGESRPVALQPTSSGGLIAVTYDKTDRAGIYELTLPDVAQPPPAGAGVAQPPSAVSSRQDFFAVNVPARESDVRRTSEDELRKLLPGFEFDYRRGGIQRAASAERSEGGELWRSLAYAVLALILIESILAQRFSG